REGLIKGSVLVRLCLLVAFGLGLHVLGESRATMAALWNGVPWILAALAGIKMCAAAWIALRLSRDRLLDQRPGVAGAALWLGVVLALHGALAWVFAMPHVPSYFQLLIALLAVPLVRPSAATLALARNRHRGTRPPSGAIATGLLPTVLVLLAFPVG